jgi:hypothetical protein
MRYLAFFNTRAVEDLSLGPDRRLTVDDLKMNCPIGGLKFLLTIER